jgi:hypothetical protein
MPMEQWQAHEMPMPLAARPSDDDMNWLEQHCRGPQMKYTGSKPIWLPDRIAVLHGFDLGDWFPRIPYHALKKQQQPPMLDKEASERHTAFHGTNAMALFGIVRDRQLSRGGPDGTGHTDAVYARESFEEVPNSGYYAGVVCEVVFFGVLSNYSTVQKDSYGKLGNDWRAMVLKSQPFRHLRWRGNGHTILFLNEPTTRITKIWVEIRHLRDLAC